MNIMISHILAKLYGLIQEKSLTFGLRTRVKELKGKLVLGGITQPSTTLPPLGSSQRNATIVKLISFVVLWTLEKLSTLSPEISFGRGLKRSWFLLN